MGDCAEQEHLYLTIISRNGLARAGDAMHNQRSAVEIERDDIITH